MEINNVKTINKKRIDWIDAAKFCGIILMVVGHALIPKDEILRGAIFSFHMPLFFILSFMTLHLSKSYKDFFASTKRRAIHLLIPYFATALGILSVRFIIKNSLFFRWDYWREFLLSLFGDIGAARSYSVGPIWFLLALFVAESLFDLLHLCLKDDRPLFVISLLFTVIGVIIGLRGYHLLFAFDIVLACFIFYYFGYYLRKYKFKKYTRLLLICSLGIWALTFYLTYPVPYLWTYFELWARRYPLFPICHICSIAGSLFLMAFSIIFCKIKYVSKPFVILGRHTLVLLCVHTISTGLLSRYIKFYKDIPYVDICIRVAIGFAFALIIIVILELLKARKNKLKA